jgi:phage-related protein
MPSIPDDLKAISNDLEPQGATVTLMRIDLPNGSESILLTTNNEDLTFNGDTYQAFSFAIGSDEQNADGNAGETQIVIANRDGEWDDIMNSTEGLTDSQVTLHFGNTLYIATPANWLTTTLIISNATESDQSIVLSIVPVHLFSVTTPQVLVERDACPHTYKDPVTCRYAGNLPTCDQTFWGDNGCLAHDNEANFGGSPSIPRPK